MKNPWNVKMEVNFDRNKKEAILNWYNSIMFYSAYNNNRVKKINDNPLNEEYKIYLQKIYNEGYGYKIIARWLDLSYTQIRTLFRHYLNLNVREGHNISTEIVRKFRSERVKGKNSPWYNWPEKYEHLNESCKKGVQGYYKRKNGEYIWLRSTWEYIYAKWLDRYNIKWEYESKTYLLSNGQTYRPDFKIYQENHFYLVEIKGSLYKHRLYKIKLFKKQYKNIEIIIIKDIKKYTNIGYIKELREWKKKKLSKEELKKLK
jgi:hypothetical protein